MFHFECLHDWFQLNQRCAICNLDYSKQTAQKLREVTPGESGMSPFMSGLVREYLAMRDNYSLKLDSGALAP